MTIAENLKNIRSELGNTKLVAVSKKQPMEKLHAALDAGQRIFGENRVQEAGEHWQTIRDNGQYPDLKLHLIGPLQTNKAATAVALFDVIETLDRKKLARALTKEMTKQNRHLPCYIQVNTGEEPQKAGIIPAELPEFLTFATQECGLTVEGLMCIPPQNDPPALHFAFLAKQARALNLPKLSMGMSNDYPKAIALGATSVRIGTALFGER